MSLKSVSHCVRDTVSRSFGVSVNCTDVSVSLVRRHVEIRAKPCWGSDAVGWFDDLPKTGKTRGIPPRTAFVPSSFAAVLRKRFSVPLGNFHSITVAPYLSIFTDARRLDVFIATATYSAVLVVFLGNLQQGQGLGDNWGLVMHILLIFKKLREES